MLYRGDNMSVFLQRFIQNKKYILIAIGVTGLIGFLFGFYQYTHTQEPIQKFFHYLFYLNIESYTNHYQLYIIQSGLLIFICTYLSTSYVGQLGLLFITFLKGLQISFSLQYVLSVVQMNVIMVILILCEILFEIIIVSIIVYIGLYISSYVTLVNFYIEQNFNIKSILKLFTLLNRFKIYIIILI